MNVRLASLLTASLLAACSAGNDSSSTGNPSSTNTGGTGGSGGQTTSGPSGGAGAQGGSGGGFMTTGGSTNCTDQDADTDNDGWSIAEGDCNDCDKNVSPSAIEFVGEPTATGGSGGTGGAGGGPGGGGEGGAYVPVDEDCDGEIDEAPEPPCDDGLALNSSSPIDGARAIELCRQASGPKDWGIVTAAYTRSNGSAYTVNAQVGLQASFGPNVPPLRGGSLLSLSSGFSRLPGQPGACTGYSCNNGSFTPVPPPPGYPQDVPGCPIGEDVNDDVALDLVLRAPSNATGYKFNFKFHSFEYGEFVCTAFNDQFIALVDPPPMGSQDGNISFDSLGNPVSVNVAFFDVCASCADFASNCSPIISTCPPVPNPCCPAGPDQLIGTGFDNAFGSNAEDGGGTSWLQTKAPIGGGEEFNLRFAIWDTNDQGWDSTVIIDNFEWIANGGTVLVETVPE